MTRPILLPHRLRQIERPFGWIPLSLLREGHFGALSTEAKVLYCLLCIVSDRRGISFYGTAKLQQLTGLDRQGLEHARDELVQRDLMAVDPDSPTVQLLSLPPKHRLDDARRSPNTTDVRDVPVTPPARSNTATEQHLLAVRQLISQLTGDKRPKASRSPDHATQTTR